METQKLSQLEKLRRQKQQIEARLQQAEARHKDLERKADTRRKILLGAYFLDKFRKEGNLDTLKPELDQFLKRNSDRKLFDLPMIDTESIS